LGEYYENILHYISIIFIIMRRSQHQILQR